MSTPLQIHIHSICTPASHDAQRSGLPAQPKMNMQVPEEPSLQNLKGLQNLQSLQNLKGLQKDQQNERLHMQTTANPGSSRLQGSSFISNEAVCCSVMETNTPPTPVPPGDHRDTPPNGETWRPKDLKTWRPGDLET
ncbi:hypothetical protein FQA47_006442 [Oryzias melastigma]|uniref:Uncharacterized protein n=1 Tax=Oryzias melastigma TaxID=30732 RepID=A0A834F9Q5_ORYME|nr:hypothetical protein FQA47_006442 [Oryzias melastigma]